MLQKLRQKEQFKRLQKLQETGNKIADKITSIGKTKEKEKEKTKEIEEIYIPLEKDNLLMTFGIWNGISKNYECSRYNL